jgi:glucosamine-6-phosphate isomerase
MDTRIFENKDALSEAVCDYILELIIAKPNATIVLTSGDTPKQAYALLAQKATADMFKNVFIIGLDEWVGIPPTSSGSCRYIVEENLLKPVGISNQNYTFFDGLTTDLQFECKRIDNLIIGRGGLDFILLGLGQNGHLGLNEPGSSFNLYSHVSILAEETISVGQKYFEGETALSKGITIGIKHILEAKIAMVIASGASKANIVNKLLKEEISPDIPATAIKLHNRGLLWVDEEASSKVK